MFHILIPTYKRCNTFVKKTYRRIIQRYNLQEHCTLLIQNDEDEEAYRTACPDLAVMRTPPGLLETVNHVVGLPEFEGKQLVLMHDDLTRIFTVDEHAKRHNLDDATALFLRVFELMQQEQCTLGGVYPANMPLSMYKKPEYSTGLYFVHDPLTFTINTHQLQLQLPEPAMEQKMDWLRMFMHYEADGKVLRLNRVGIGTVYNPQKNREGGGFGVRSSEQEKEVAQLVLGLYPQYIRSINYHKRGGTSFRLNSKMAGGSASSDLIPQKQDKQDKKPGIPS